MYGDIILWFKIKDEKDYKEAVKVILRKFPKATWASKQSLENNLITNILPTTFGVTDDGCCFYNLREDNQRKETFYDLDSQPTLGVE